ncbi:FAD-dependent oxidoreductase [Rhodococcus sp. ACS1]|uniref:NAD(P)/FAD-dependent oxidoreductase n=1 Tax=Rhodococcus sp. ACS1 TaxID=2028570 RepID=UPI000BB14097|nr:FAD-dependent oxidoreductase [Rhodococcus sp. ACS1]PBC35628.1 FAD-dependent oxidoreductase [Rhodococcus sp. ACS1]
MTSVDLPHTPPESVVVIGASAAGLATVTKLRRDGYEGKVTLLGEEAHAPYDRPPLSKKFLTGAWEPEKLALASSDQLTDLNTDIRLSTRVAAMDIKRGLVVDDTGLEYPYEAAVIATGVRPRPLPAVSTGTPHVLRTISDARRLKDCLRAGKRLLIVGAGFLGLEAAGTAVRLGAHVTVVETALFPLSSRLGITTSNRLLALHGTNGIDLRLGVAVEDARIANSNVWTVDLSDGETIEADEVLVAIGSIPVTEWLDGSGVDIDNGVVCDSSCQAVPGVWAAGDVARWWDVRHEKHIRTEHRTNATEQAQFVASAILGKKRSYVPVPFFWTDQYDVRIQVAGHIPEGAVEEVLESGSHEDSTISLFHKDGTLTGVLGWNAPREVSKYRRELLAQNKVWES